MPVLVKYPHTCQLGSRLEMPPWLLLLPPSPFALRLFLTLLLLDVSLFVICVTPSQSVLSKRLSSRNKHQSPLARARRVSPVSPLRMINPGPVSRLRCDLCLD